MRMTPRASLLAAACSALVLLSGCSGSAAPLPIAASQPAVEVSGSPTPEDAVSTSPEAYPTITAAPTPTHKPKVAKPKPLVTHKPATRKPATKKPAPRRTTKAPVYPAGASAVCRDGSISYSAHRQGTCSHHGGVAKWL